MTRTMNHAARLIASAVVLQFVLCFAGSGGATVGSGAASAGSPPVTTCSALPFAGFSGGLCGTGPGVRPP